MNGRPLRILLIGPASLEVVGGTTVSFSHLRSRLEELPDVRVRVISSMGIRGEGLKGVLRLMRLMARIMASAPRCDVIGLHAMPTGIAYWGWYVALVAKLWRRPLVYRAFGGMYYDELGSIARPAAAILMHKADCVLLQTKELLAKAAGDRLRRVEWFPTARPMPTDVIPRNGPCRRFCYIGQLKVRKGLQHLARVAERLPDDAVVDVYGPWYDLPRDTFAGKQRIVYHRELRPDEVASVLKEHDALVFPSFLQEEGHAGIIPEAYAAGIPVITTRWKALPEIVEDGSSGLLIEPQDDEELFAAMMQLYGDDGLYRRLAAGTATMRQRFSVAAQADNYVRICRELVGG